MMMLKKDIIKMKLGKYQVLLAARLLAAMTIKIMITLKTMRTMMMMMVMMMT